MLLSDEHERRLLRGMFRSYVEWSLRLGEACTFRNCKYDKVFEMGKSHSRTYVHMAAKVEASTGSACWPDFLSAPVCVTKHPWMDM